MCMKKIKIVTFVLFVLGIFFLPKSALAEGSTEDFSFKAYKTDIIACEYDFESCEMGDELQKGGYLEPGQIFQVDLYYSPGDVGNKGFNLTVNYDNTVFEPISYDGSLYVDDHTYATASYNGGVWPPKNTTPSGKKTTEWVLAYNDTGSQLTFAANNANGYIDGTSKPYVTEGVFASFWLKVKDDAQAGAVLDLTFNNNASDMAVQRIDGVKETIRTTDISFTVFGQMSSNASLDTLSLIGNNGLNYITNPLFHSGTSDRKFSVIVPYSVSSINIAATAVDNTATVLSGGLGNKLLSVGDNTFNVVVQPQSSSGSAEVYEIKIKRLSNDTSLKTLSLSGVTLDNQLTSGIYTYTATVPYSISNTTVSATTTDTNASIKEGTGSWNLSNTGATLNTKKLTVEAEDCNSIYTSVVGNSCTSKDYTLNVTRTKASSDNNLTDIKIDGVSISGFTSSTLEYTLPNVANNKSTINITGVLSDTKARLTGDGVKNLNIGDNTITLTVTAEDKSTKEYVIKVRRLSNNANLKTLNVTSTPQGVLSPNFTPTFSNYYTYTYDSTVTGINIAATTEDTNATVTSGTGSYSSGDSGANIVVTAEDGTTKTYVVKFSRNKSSDNTLKSLSIDGVSFNEAFSKTTTLYTATVSGTVDSINVNAVVNDSNAVIVSGTGNHNLNYGTNTIQVRVRAENNTTKDYTITVTRSKKTISTLSDLTVDGTTVSGFNEATQTYNYGTVPYNKTSVEIGYTKKDSDATVTGDGTFNLNTGNNTARVVVTAQDGKTTTTYEIQIYRTPSNNAYLSNLSVDGYPFTFNKETNDYNIEVPYEVNSVNITATLEDSAAVIAKGGPNGLSVGDNLYTFAVTAEDGSTTNIYNLKVTRKKSTNTDLSNLMVINNGTNYLGAFNKDTTTYNITVDNSVDSVSINATLADSINQTITGDGEKTLSPGLNTFEVIVTSASNDTKTYTINITRSLNNNNKLASLSIVDQTLSPSFSPNQTSYSVTVSSETSQIVIEGSPEVNTSTVTGLGVKTLTTGTNTFSIDVKAENNDVKTYVIVVTKLASNDSSLKSLSIEEALLNEAFNKDLTSYTASVSNSVDEIHISAEANDKKAKSVTGIGTVSLKTGDNTIQIVVTAEDNTTTTYTLIVNRAKSLNANLSNLTLSNGYMLDQTFDKDTLEYTATVPNSASKVLISAVKEDPKATVTGAGEVSLKTGDNEINITVSAEDTSVKKVYKVKIYRTLSNNAFLKELSSSDGLITPTFNKQDNNYTLTVPYEVENPNLQAVAEDSNANISITGNTSLSVGVNHATVTVTAEDGTINTYYVDITRQPSSNNFLSDLKVEDSEGKNYIEVFSKTNLTYNITVSNEITSLEITAVAEDHGTTISGDGTKNIEVGNNSFTVVSRSADGTNRNYIINVTREKNKNTNLASLSIDGQTLVPDFNPNEVSYQINVDASVSEININASAEVTTTTVTGDGTKQLQTGINTFNVVTEAEDGTTKTYVIIVNKAASSNNYLASLLASETLSPTFNRETIDYSVTVPNETDSIHVEGIAEDANATVSGNGDHSLTVGNNSVLITVTAEDNTFRAYTINVYREPSTNNYLSDLKINNETISDFNREKINYSINVTNDVTQLDILGIAEDIQATVVGNKTWYLQTGLNTTNITVTSESGESKIYTIEVTRDKSSNNYLALLSALEGSLSPNFTKEVTEYTMDVPYEITSLNLTTVAEDGSALVEVEGNIDFQIGSSNMVYIAVTAEDGTVKKYQIQVTRLPQANNFLSNLTVVSDSGKNYSLTPEFNKNTLNYTIDIDANDNILTIGGTKEASSATVVGLETITVDRFPYVHKVVVTSAGGVSRTYSITINKIKSSNANLKQLNVSDGVLSPTFNENTTSYSVTVSSDVDHIDIDALGYDGSSIVGDGTHSLDYGDNTIQIAVTAEDGSTKSYTINVVRQQSIDATLDNIHITSGQLNPTFNQNILDYIAYLSNDATSMNITPVVSNPLAKMSISLNDSPYQEISDITITDLTIENRVKIKVEGSNETNIYTVSILNQATEKITSDIYGHTIEDGMIKTVKINTTAEDMKDQLDNDNSKLKIYKSNGVEEYTGNKIGTGMIVKLFINNVVVDQKVIVVVGDTDGNGEINAIDALKVVNHIIETEKLSGCYLTAADTTYDTTINAIDALKIVNHIIGNEVLG